MTKTTDSQQQHLQQLQHFEPLVCCFRRLCRMFRWFSFSQQLALVRSDAAAIAAAILFTAATTIADIKLLSTLYLDYRLMTCLLLPTLVGCQFCQPEESHVGELAFWSVYFG